MQIYVDADACPVVGIVEELAIKYKIPVTLLCDTNHVLYSDYSEVKIIGAGADAVDFALVNLDRMLLERHMNKKARRASGKNHLKGPKKRNTEDDMHFRESFEKMIRKGMENIYGTT